jgi:hypothetical protein
MAHILGKGKVNMVGILSQGCAKKPLFRSCHELNNKQNENERKQKDLIFHSMTYPMNKRDTSNK